MSISFRGQPNGSPRRACRRRFRPIDPRVDDLLQATDRNACPVDRDRRRLTAGGRAWSRRTGEIPWASAPACFFSQKATIRTSPRFGRSGKGLPLPTEDRSRVVGPTISRPGHRMGNPLPLDIKGDREQTRQAL
jgi:hypothetical protein